MAELSPAAQSVWDAFNQDEAGVFVDYGDKLAAALRAAADQVEAPWWIPIDSCCDVYASAIRSAFYSIADELNS